MDEVRARIIVQEKGLYIISYEGRENLAEISGKYRFETSSISDYPAVGDYVVASWPEDGSHSIITALFPRKSVFIRKAAGTAHEEQVVAANIDTVFICMSLNRDFNLRRLERYITVAWDSGATPVVVLTKSDLCEDPDSKVFQAGEIANGVDIVTTSSRNDDTQGLKRYLAAGKTVAFIGASGVGKSTLINTIIGENLLKTSEIREDDDKGRHTTTRRQLIELENGAFVIDTPGMRELGLWNSEEGVEAVFSDVEELISRCRFADCTHTNEPGCKICEALKRGQLDVNRWNSYQKLLIESSYSSDPDEYLKSKEAKFKKIAKLNKKK